MKTLSVCRRAVRGVPIAAALASILVPAAAPAETFNLQFRAYCRDASKLRAGEPPHCGYWSEQESRDLVLQRIGEMNLEFKPSGISFRPNQPQPVIIKYDHYYSGITASKYVPGTTSEDTSLDGFDNATLLQELIYVAAQEPGVLTIFLLPNLGNCWNDIPCPGRREGFDGEDVIFCRPDNPGTTYAHEMGHMWCLTHTFTRQDPATDHPIDRDLDDNVDANGQEANLCFAVTDTPEDPGRRSASSRLTSTTAIRSEGTSTRRARTPSPWRATSGATPSRPARCSLSGAPT